MLSRAAAGLAVAVIVLAASGCSRTRETASPRRRSPRASRRRRSMPPSRARGQRAAARPAFPRCSGAARARSACPGRDASCTASSFPIAGARSSRGTWFGSARRTAARGALARTCSCARCSGCSTTTPVRTPAWPVSGSATSAARRRPVRPALRRPRACLASERARRRRPVPAARRPGARPTWVSQIDHRLAQDLVDRFVAAGALYVFVGPHTGLTGPRRIVVPLAHHDNHMHVRLRRPAPR